MRVILVIVLVVIALAVLAHVIFQTHPEANTEMPLVYCHSQGGVVKDGKCVKKGTP